MQIAFVILPYQKFSGAGNYYHNLFTSLKKIDAENQYCAYLPLDAPDEAFEFFGKENSFRMDIPSKPSFARILKSLSARDSIFTSKPDVLHYFNIPIFKTSIPSVLTIYDVRDRDIPLLTAGQRTIAGRMLRQSSITRANHIIAISEFTQKRINHFFPKAKDKTTSIHLGVESDFNSKKINMKVHPRSYILAVGHIEQRKNYLFLLNAYITMLQKDTTFLHDLIIIGKSIDKKELAKVLELSRKWPQRIYVKGSVGQDELMAFYSQASLVVFPSMYEGFGLPLLEAMASNVPIISSNSSAFPEVMINPEFMFKGTDSHELIQKIKLGLHNEEFRNANIMHGQKQKALFTWDKCALETLQVYNNVLKVSL